MTGAIDFTWEESPVGRLLLAASDEGLKYLLFAEGRGPVTPGRGWREDGRRLADAVRQLREYFGGARQVFDLALAPEGTPFQRK